MYPYIVCPTCCKSMGEYYLIYNYIRLQLLNKKYNKGADKVGQMNLADNMMHTMRDTVPGGQILKHIHFEKDCCRQSMVTQQIFVEYKWL